MAMSSTQAPQREHAFTLVEILVVLFIAAVIGAIAIGSVGSSRETGQRFNALAVAHAYANSVDDFARDHGGRYPAPPGNAADWPDAKRGPSSSLLGDARFYMRRIPESIQDGNVVIGASATKPAIAYSQLAGGGGYQMIVTIPGRDSCRIVGGTTTGATVLPACGRR